MYRLLELDQATPPSALDCFQPFVLDVTDARFFSYRSQTRPWPWLSVTPCRHSPAKRPMGPPAGRSLTKDRSDLSLLRDLQGVVNLYAKISHCRFELGVAKKQLHSAQILCSLVD